MVNLVNKCTIFKSNLLVISRGQPSESAVRPVLALRSARSCRPNGGALWWHVWWSGPTQLRTSASLLSRHGQFPLRNVVNLGQVLARCLVSIQCIQFYQLYSITTVTVAHFFNQLYSILSTDPHLHVFFSSLLYCTVILLLALFKSGRKDRPVSWFLTPAAICTIELQLFTTIADYSYIIVGQLVCDYIARLYPPF